MYTNPMCISYSVYNPMWISSTYETEIHIKVHIFIHTIPIILHEDSNELKHTTSYFASGYLSMSSAVYVSYVSVTICMVRFSNFFPKRSAQVVSKDTNRVKTQQICRYLIPTSNKFHPGLNCLFNISRIDEKHVPPGNEIRFAAVSNEDFSYLRRGSLIWSRGKVKLFLYTSMYMCPYA